MSLPRSIVFATDSLDPLPDLARRAEAAGFHRVWTTEYLGRDAVARAITLALATETIGVGTGVAYAFTRAARAMAALAADVQRLSRGRFALGVSTGTRGVRRWYGAEFDPPAPRLAEYAEALRTAWATDTPDVAPPPVFGAALNPIMARHVGRTCDGVVLHPLGIGRTHLYERVLPALRRGREERGAPIEIAAWCITSIDADEDAARERARAQLAFYLSTPSYRTIAEGTEWEAVPVAVREAFDASGRRASWAELAALIPDSLVDELTVWGSPDAVRDRVDRLEGELGEAGVTELVMQTVGTDLDESTLVANCEHIIDVLGPLTTTTRRRAWARP